MRMEDRGSRIAQAATIFSLVVLFLTPCVAQERVRVGWAAMTASHTPLWVAQEKGFLSKQGLLAESIFFGAGPPAMQAPVAGDLDIVVTSAPNVVDLFRRAATYVDKILKGTKRADLPVEPPMRLEFVVNLKTAKQIDLTIPPNVLVRATRVIK